MKSIKTLLLAFVLMFISAAAFGQINDWKQQKDFHAVMSKTFHPAEEGNLQPIKSRSSELLAKAVAWRNSAVPAGIKDKKAVTKTLKELVKGSEKLDRTIKKGASDAEIVKQLTGLHDTFHTIVGLCNAKEDHHDH